MSAIDLAIVPCSAIYFLEVGAHVSLKVATEVFLEVKNILKFRFLDYFSKEEREECDQEDWSLINLELLHLFQLHIIWKWMQPFD